MTTRLFGSAGRAALACLVFAAWTPARSHAQAAPPTGEAERRDTVRTVQSGIFDRPFIATMGRTAVGGYVEANANLSREAGIGDGLSMELRRFNIFLFSTISSRVRFLSELEFEHGTEEIALETALIDVQVNPSFVLRGGILLPPLGAFNVNHDSPRWNFVDRPLVSTRVIPATLSEVGFGVHGRLAPRGFGLTYDLYLVNGLGEGVLSNAEGRTSLASGKSAERFAEDNNGSPAFTGRVAVQQGTLGEVGLSWYAGVYNTPFIDGERVDATRRVSLGALDVTTQLGPVELRGEAALVRVDVPDDLRDLFGAQQWGYHVDATMPVWRPRVRGFPDAVVHADVRLEQIDLNDGRFASTLAPIGDEVTALSVGVSVRPVSGTVLKLNYRRSRTVDLLGNAAVAGGAFQVGFATYF
ncbi:MAG: hypothetical protein ACKVS7_11960 [Gemmatimonadaceae bacterium]